MKTPYQDFNAPPQGIGRGQKLAKMLQMQGQTQQVVSNGDAQTDMQYNPPQNAANLNPAPRQFGQMYPRKGKSPGLMTPQGGPDRSNYDGY